MRTLLILILLAIASPSWANPLILMSGPSAAPAASYLINEEFGTGSDANWSVADSAATFSPDWAASTTPINGAYLRVTTSDGTGRVTYKRSFTSQSTVYATVAIRRSAFGAETNSVLLFLDASDNVLGSLNCLTNGNIVANIYGGSNSANIATLSTDTWYYLKLEYVAGTAGTGVSFTGWVSSDGSSWGTPQTVTGSVGATNNANQLSIKSDIRDITGTSDFDRVRVSTSDISY